MTSAAWRLDGTYCGPPPVPADLWQNWNLDFPLSAILLAMAITFRWNRQGLAAVLTLALIFLSPLCPLSSALFSARAVHHVLLMTVAAPLLAIAMPARTRGGLALPFVAFAGVLWLWHLPAAYDWAMTHKAVYWLMQATMLAASLWFWRAVFAHSDVFAISVVTAGFAQMGLLGALLTFAPEPLYAIHAQAPFAWSLTPLADQQLAGLLMWVPAGIPILAVVAILARRQWREVPAA
jgi:putative membrane protein